MQFRHKTFILIELKLLDEKNFLNDFSTILNSEMEKKLNTAKSEITEEIRANLKTIFSINKGVLEKIDDLEKNKTNLKNLLEKQNQENIEESLIGN